MNPETNATVLDVTKGVWDYFLKRHPFIFFFLVILPVFISIGVAYVEFTVDGSALFQSQGSEIGALVIIALPLLVSIITFIVVRSRIEKLFFTELAAALGCTYSEVSPPPSTGQFANIMSSSRRFSNVLSGTYSNLQFQLGDYTYETGDAKHRQRHPYTLGIITMNGSLPHVSCVPRNWTRGEIINKWKPLGTKDLSLEGNFNSIFSVYVPEGSEIEALQILQPDVMEKLMDGYADFGFESIDSSIYLFTTGSMKENRDTVMRIYTLLQRFCDVLTPELHSFSAT